MSILKRKEPLLMDPIHRVKLEMEGVELSSDEYDKMLNRLERLVKLQQNKQRINPDVVVAGLANIIGILMIVTYEHNHVLVSKGLQMLRRTETP